MEFVALANGRWFPDVEDTKQNESRDQVWPQRTWRQRDECEDNREGGHFVPHDAARVLGVSQLSSPRTDWYSHHKHDRSDQKSTPQGNIELAEQPADRKSPQTSPRARCWLDAAKTKAFRDEQDDAVGERQNVGRPKNMNENVGENTLSSLTQTRQIDYSQNSSGRILKPARFKTSFPQHFAVVFATHDGGCRQRNYVYRVQTFQCFSPTIGHIMSTADVKLSKLEALKEGSHQLRGSIPEELLNDEPTFSADASQMLKHHGSYMQDDRDVRKQKNEDGTKKAKAYSCMVRTRIPGGRVTADQFLAELDLCDRLANGTVRITSRQGFQLHGVLKSNLKETIRAINDTKLTTYAACGDVNRNVMCCPAPYKNNAVYDQIQALSQELADHFKPKSTSYFDIWLTDEDGEKTDVTAFQPAEEPIYGERYLPRKFKMAIALPEDNCIDIYTQDLGLLAIVEDDKIVGYNVIVGGGMGRTPSKKDTFPRVGDKMCYVPGEEAVAVAEAIVKVQRDFGNREDRKRARMKYLLHDWGVAKFKAKVEEYYGQSLAEPHAADVTGVDDHMGWHEQGDGKWFLGINVENGRIKDEGDLRLKAGLRAILSKFGMDTRLTALQSIILCDIDESNKDEINSMLAEYGIKRADELSLIRRYSIACPAFPTCGLSITESERVLPELIDELDQEIAKQGLESDKIAVHMTGCPNGCARPYTPDIGLVGRAVGKYTLFLGGNPEGTRVGFIYKDMVPLEEVVSELSPLLTAYKSERQDGESFGDYCARIGNDALQEKAA